MKYHYRKHPYDLDQDAPYQLVERITPDHIVVVGHCTEEEAAHDLTQQLNLLAFMQQHLPETYKRVTEFYEEYQKAPLATRGESE